MATLADIKAKLKAKGYKNKDIAAEQILEVLTNFRYLRLSQPNSASNAEEAMMNDKCVALVGTIPVVINGHEYFIPITIQVMVDHPRSPPHIYVKPTDNMELVISSKVNQFGRVKIEFMNNWTRESNMNDLITIMCIEFADGCPVQARRTPAPTQSFNPAPAGPYQSLPPQQTPQQPVVNSGTSEFQRSWDRAFNPSASGQTRTPLPPPQNNYHLEQQFQRERAQYERTIAEEQERSARAEKSLYDNQMLITQTQQALFREEQRANLLEEKVYKLQADLEAARSQLDAAARGRREAEERVRALQRGITDKKEQQYWIVRKDEIQTEQKQLGAGGWATVKVAKFRHLQVAAKYMHQLIISDYNRELFVREMNMAARMRHPNIVQFIGANMEGEAVILTELMPTSLRAQYAKQMLTYPQVVLISEDVAKGLNYLHLMKPDPIIHRDISSANVLLEPLRDNKWRAKICDCGSANFAQLTNTAGPGNPVYAAPEAETPKMQSPLMDVFSYGILLLETNTQRFPDPRTRELLFDMLGHRDEMVALIRWCMKPTPTDRPCMEEVLETLERFEAKFKAY